MPYYDNQDKIENWIKMVTGDTSNCQWSIDQQSGEIEITGDIWLQRGYLLNGELPYKIHRVIGNVYASNVGLKSFKNFPDEIIGSLICSENNIKSLVGMPKISVDCDLSWNYIETLSGIQDVLDTLTITTMHTELEDLSGIFESTIGRLLIDYRYSKNLDVKLFSKMKQFALRENRVTIKDSDIKLFSKNDVYK